MVKKSIKRCLSLLLSFSMILPGVVVTTVQAATPPPMPQVVMDQLSVYNLAGGLEQKVKFTVDIDGVVPISTTWSSVGSTSVGTLVNKSLDSCSINYTGKEGIVDIKVEISLPYNGSKCYYTKYLKIYATNDSQNRVPTGADYSTYGVYDEANKTITLSGSGVASGRTLGGTHITKLVVGMGITDLEGFSGLKGLEEVYIEDGSNLVTVGDKAFYQLGLTKINLENATKLTRLENEAFRSVEKLTSVTIPESVTFLGSYSVPTADTVTVLSKMNFSTATMALGWNSIQNLYVQGGLQTSAADRSRISGNIRCSAISGEFALDPKVRIGNSTNEDFFYLNNGSSITIGDYIGDSKDVVVPENIDSLPVEKINNLAFMDKKEVRSITLSSGVKEIGASVFTGCTSLETIVNKRKASQILPTVTMLSPGLTSLGAVYGEPSNVTFKNKVVADGYYWVDISTAHQHSWTVTTPATCTTSGLQTCTCGSTEVIPATGHALTVTTPATCTLDGVRTCSKCGETQSILATGHALTVTTTATCTTEGLKTCSRCGETQIIPALGHTWQVVEEGTCTTVGKKKCSKCGVEEEVSAPGHKITWNTSNFKTDYLLGEQLDLSKLSYSVECLSSTPCSEDGVIVHVLPDDVAGYNPDLIGEQTISVTAGGKTKQFIVSVTDNRATSVNFKFTDTSGVELTSGSIKIYDGGTEVAADSLTNKLYTFKQDVAADGYIVSKSFTKELAKGPNEIVVINEAVKDIVSIELQNVPKKILQYSELDTSGIYAIAEFTDGVKLELNSDTVSLVLGDTSKIGVVNFKFDVYGMEVLYNIEVFNKVLSIKELKTDGFKKEYAVGDALDVTNLILVLTTETGDIEVDVEESMVSDFDSTSLGVKRLKVTYDRFTTSTVVTVVEKFIEPTLELSFDSSTYSRDFVKIGVIATGSYKSITLPNGSKIFKTPFEYVVVKNGSYTFSLDDKLSKTIDVSNIDNEKPTILLNYKLDDLSSISIDAIDTLSGVKTIKTPDNNLVNYTGAMSYDIANGAGTVVAEDNVGNIGTKDLVVSQQIIGGSSSSTLVALEGIPSDWTNQPVVLKYGAFNATDGVKDVELQVKDAVTPEVVVPEVIAPKLLELKSATPEVVVPEVVVPEVIVPETVVPETVEPEVVEPEVIIPEVIIPEGIESELLLNTTLLPVKEVELETVADDVLSYTPVVKEITITENGNYNFSVTTSLGEYDKDTNVSKIDMVNPVIKVNELAAGSFSYNCSDNLSGIKKIVFPDGTTTDEVVDGVLSKSGTFTYAVSADSMVTVYDYAGNVSSVNLSSGKKPEDKPADKPEDKNKPSSGGGSSTKDEEKVVKPEDKKEDKETTDSTSAGKDRDGKDLLMAKGFALDARKIKDGYISGYPDKEFKASKNITREEFTSILDRVLVVTKENLVDVVNFADLDASWGKESINRLASAKVVYGVGNNKFNPTSNITREHAVLMLTRALDLSMYPVVSSLKDLDDSASSKAISQAFNAGIISGDSKGNFNGKEYISRAEVVVIINNVVYSNNLTTKENKFKDLSSADWYYSDVLKASK